MLPVINNSTTNNDSMIILLPTSNGVYIVDTTTIIRIQSISNYSKLFFSNGKTLVVAKVLAWFEEKLSGRLFARVHRSHLISLRYVQAYCNNHDSKIILYDNTAINISRRKKVMIRKIFKDLEAA